MPFFSRLFGSKQPDDFEQALEKLALDIQKRETRLSEIRLRERRSTLLFSVYAIAFWAGYGSLWYLDLIPTLSGHSRNSKFEKAVQGLPVFVGPIVILFIRRIVQIWYTRTGDAEEKALVTLRKQRRDTIEEIKKKTNYYTTRNLLERFDDGSSSGVAGSPRPLRQRQPQQPSQAPVTPKRPPQPANPQTPQPHLTPGLQQHLSPSPQRPLPPPRKQWFDKLADAILGDDEGTTAGAASRYALICQKCFAHNGLVKESMWEDAQYVCPKCGHFNPSARAMREARAGSKSPQRTGAPVQLSPIQPQPGQPQGFAPPIQSSIEANGAAAGRANGFTPSQNGDGAVGGPDASMEVDS